MSSLSKILSSFGRLRLSDISDVGKAYFYLALAGWRLFVKKETGTRWIRTSITADPEHLDLVEEGRVKRAAHWVNGAAHVPVPWARCLQRCVALCIWMERQGLSPTLRLGVRKTANGIDAHSWVEINGRVVNDDESVQRVFAQFSTDKPSQTTKQIRDR